jgi:hypothetical protein
VLEADQSAFCNVSEDQDDGSDCLQPRVKPRESSYDHGASNNGDYGAFWRSVDGLSSVTNQTRQKYTHADNGKPSHSSVFTKRLHLLWLDILLLRNCWTGNLPILRSSTRIRVFERDKD